MRFSYYLREYECLRSVRIGVEVREVKVRRA